jgi:gliding motility-associated-like protein
MGSAPLPPPAINTDCVEPTTFFDTDPTSTAWLWDFGDGTPPSTIRNPKHYYAAAGTYTVTLSRTISSTTISLLPPFLPVTISLTSSPVTKTITIGSPPPQPMFFGKKKADTTICDGKILKLDPYLNATAPAGAKFVWFPNGETTQSIDVTKASCYSVEVFDASGGCSLIAQINVKVCLTPPSTGGTEKWYFGKGASLNFQKKTSPPIPRDPLDDNGDLFSVPEGENPIYIPIDATQSNPINSPEGTAMVYDPSGNLVLYTDGVEIYGKDDNILPALPPLTDSKLGGTNTSTQSSVIVPKGSCNECPHHLYYVYTINKTTGLLSYSIVDLRRNNGTGAVVEKDIPVSLQTSQRLTAQISNDTKAFFVYSHDAGTNTFRILKVDSTGTTETTQNLGLVHDTPLSQQGYMRLSPTGTKMAVAVVKDGKNYVEIFDVDNKTGRLGATPTTIDLGIAAPPNIYGVEFSADNNLLYVTLRGDPTLGQKSYLYQLNINLANPAQIATTKIKIDESATLAFGALQMGPISGVGGKFIYMAVDGSQYLPYMTYPDEKGGAAIVGYQPILTGTDVLGNSGFGLPNVIQAKPKQDGEALGAKYTGNCQGIPTVFETQGICSPMKVNVDWDFGDGTKGTGLSASHIYTKAGTYTVTLTAHVLSETAASKVITNPLLGDDLREKCKDFTVTDVITIKPSPQINLPDLAFVCIIEGANIILDPKAEQTVNPAYLWNAGSQTTPTIIASAAGIYTVKVTNQFSNSTICANTDKTEVVGKCEPRLFIPEIFTANNDGINDKLVTPNAYITDFELRIYNRWGEIIFQSNNQYEPWDGKYKGEVVAPMMYAFVVSYKSSDFPDRGLITRRGAIMLVN